MNAKARESFVVLLHSIEKFIFFESEALWENTNRDVTFKVNTR